MINHSYLIRYPNFDSPILNSFTEYIDSSSSLFYRLTTLVLKQLFFRVLVAFLYSLHSCLLVELLMVASKKCSGGKSSLPVNILNVSMRSPLLLIAIPVSTYVIYLFI